MQTTMQNSSKFFANTSCSYFPCHEGLDEGEFNCLFCYCPLYAKNPCPGNPTFIKKEDGRIIKRCTDCTFPHKPENYERIMRLLRTKKESSLTEEYHHGGEEALKSSERMRSKREERKSCLAQDEQIFCSDFSVNTNPLGLPESVKSAVKNAVDSCEKYPDQNCTCLKEKLASQLSKIERSLSPRQIVFGNGASELISLCVNAISPKNALLLAPTFSGYERALKICDCRIHYHFLKEEMNFDLDDGIFDSITKSSPDMIFFCNPNNPTGRMIEPALLKKIAESCESDGIFLVIDECFIDFTDRAGESALRLIKDCPHLIVINAFTKTFAMAGLRLGWLVSSNPALIQKINSLRPEWNVSTVAQIAGMAALDENDYIQKSREVINKERAYLAKELKALGFKVFSSEANFILFKVVPPKNDISLFEKLDTHLQKNGIFLRNCSNFRCLSAEFYRTAVRTHQENARLIEILRKFVLE